MTDTNKALESARDALAETTDLLRELECGDASTWEILDVVEPALALIEAALSASPPAGEGKSVRLTEDERETVEALHCDVLDHQRYLDRSAVRDVLAIIDRLAPLPSEGGEA